MAFNKKHLVNALLVGIFVIVISLTATTIITTQNVKAEMERPPMSCPGGLYWCWQVNDPPHTFYHYWPE